MKISFVIPCYKSEKTIEKVVKEIISVVNSKNDDYEIVMVSDSSPDGVYKVIRNLCEMNNKLKGIEFSKNFGQHSALMAAYSLCTGDVIVSVDDDGQIPIDETYLLIDKLSEGYDVVYAKYAEKKYNIFRRLGSKINSWMMEWLINKPRTISVTSFFVAKKYIIDEILKYKNSYPFVMGLVFRTTNRIANVIVNHRNREEGKSGYTFKKLISLWMNGFTAFSVKPLRIATIVGCICALIGFIVGIVMVVRKIIDPSIAAGYTSLIAVTLFIGGLLMLMLGLIGEYIGRIYISINNSPQYVIRDKINFNDKDDEQKR